MQEKPNTHSNRIDAMLPGGVTNRWMVPNKCAVAHPEMNSYNKVQLRVRAGLGFHEFHALHELIFEELGRKVLMHKPFPLLSSLRLDPSFLTPHGFAAPVE